MRFGNYLKTLLKFTISSSLSVGILACMFIVLVGETSMNFEIGLDVEAMDGLWVLLGVPAVVVLVVAVISPISFLIYRLLTRQGFKD